MIPRCNALGFFLTNSFLSYGIELMSKPDSKFIIRRRVMVGAFAKALSGNALDRKRLAGLLPRFKANAETIEERLVIGYIEDVHSTDYHPQYIAKYNVKEETVRLLRKR